MLAESHKLEDIIKLATNESLHLSNLLALVILSQDCRFEKSLSNFQIIYQSKWYTTQREHKIFNLWDSSDN